MNREARYGQAEGRIMNESSRSQTQLVTLVHRAKAAVAPLRAMDSDVAKAMVTTWDRLTDDHISTALRTGVTVTPHRLATIESLVNELEFHPAAEHLIEVSALMFSALPGGISVPWNPSEPSPTTSPADLGKP